MSSASTSTKPTQSAAAPIAPAPRWNVDAAHSAVTFKVRHMMVTNVRGEFTKFTGDIAFDPAELEQGSVRATVDVASISTRNEQRDAHLRSADFFDAERFPTMEFVSRSLRGKDGEWKLVGDLTIRGATHEVVLDLEGPTPAMKDPYGNVKVGVSASTAIKRSKWGMTWNAALETGGLMVADDIHVQIDLELVRS